MVGKKRRKKKCKERGQRGLNSFSGGKKWTVLCGKKGKKKGKGWGPSSHTIPLFRLFPGRPKRTFSWTWGFLGAILFDFFFLLE
jgi:hypothetical protein